MPDPVSNEFLIKRVKTLHKRLATLQLAGRGLNATPARLKMSLRYGTVSIVETTVSGKVIHIVTTNNSAYYKLLKQGPANVLLPGEIVGSRPTLVYGPKKPKKRPPRQTIHAEQLGVNDAVRMGGKRGRIATSNPGCTAQCISLLKDEFPAFKHVNPKNTTPSAGTSQSSTKTGVPNSSTSSRGVGRDSQATTNKTQTSKKPSPSKAPIASVKGGAIKVKPTSTKVPIPTKKIGKFSLFAKGLKGLGIGLIIDYTISKLIRYIKGDPVKKAFERHIRKLDGTISKAIAAQNRSIEYFLERSPGQTIYAELNLQYVLGHDGTGGDPDFVGMQLLFVQIFIKPHNSSLTKSGLPKSLNKTWTGRPWKDLLRTRYFKTETITAAISVSLPIEGDFYGTWMAGHNSKIAARTILWAVFTIRLKSGYLEVSGYMFDKNRTYKDLKITIDQVTKNHISLHVTAIGEKATKEIYIGTTKTPGFLNGVWKMKVHPDHPNPDKVLRSGQERWFRPKHAGLQRGLSKKIMHSDGVEPLYNKAWKKWKKRN